MTEINEEFVREMAEQVSKTAVSIQVLSCTNILLERLLFQLYPEYRQDYEVKMRKMVNLVISSIQAPEFGEALPEAIAKILETPFTAGDIDEQPDYEMAGPVPDPAGVCEESPGEDGDI